MKKKIKKSNSNFKINSINNIPIRVLYKKIGQAPEVKIINDVSKLKKSIIKNNLDIIPYETVYLICYNKKVISHMQPNILLSLKRIAGNFIVINIDKKLREFKSLSQEDIIWYSKDLINKTPINIPKSIKRPLINKNADIYERNFEDNRNTKQTNFEQTLLNVLINLELILANILKNNGADKR